MPPALGGRAGIINFGGVSQGRKAVAGSQWSVGGPRTDNGRRRTDDRGRTTEGGGRPLPRSRPAVSPGRRDGECLPLAVLASWREISLRVAAALGIDCAKQSQLERSVKCETRRPRQKSPNRFPIRVPERISRIGSADPDFCRTRQTKPVSTALPIGRSAFPGGERAEQSQFGGKADVGRNAQPTKSRSRGTKPIPDGGGWLYKQTQFRRGASVRNKANVPHARTGKAIPKARGLEAATHQGSKRAKQSQFYHRADREIGVPGSRGRQTKPIREEVLSLKGQVSSEQGPAARLSGLPTSNLTLETAAKPLSCETKPISGGPTGGRSFAGGSS